MNQKGIVLSGLIYSLLVFFLLLLVSLLTILWYRQNALVNLARDANKIYENLKPLPITTDFIYAKGVNKPKLVPGMVPVKWNGLDWTQTEETDLEWYDYRSAYKKWANAMTQDGSMWVWIPRYAYSIADGYHTSTVGDIDVRFLIDNTNNTPDDITVETIPTYDAGVQNNFIAHPAFTFGGTELTGIWVAKFEPSNDGLDNVRIVPDATAWGNITAGDAFDKVRSMELNGIYGWDVTGTGIDTHMMKNIEWGAVTYLTQSPYGKNAEVWINPADDYTTGCAGEGVSVSSTTGCIYSHETSKGQQASTTGNIYGIYDMSGGAYEYVSAYVDNGDPSLATYGLSIINAEAKYKDVYTKGTSDDRVSNYTNALNIYGDAIYETSSSGEGTTSWNGDYSYMPFTIYPWFGRGGNSSQGTIAGLFNFSHFNSSPGVGGTFRVALTVGDGL